MTDPQIVRERWVLQSRTLWGTLMVLAPALVETFGGGAIRDLPVINDSVLTVIDSVNEIAGAALVLYGRYRSGGTLTDRLRLARPS